MPSQRLELLTALEDVAVEGNHTRVRGHYEGGIEERCDEFEAEQEGCLVLRVTISMPVNADVLEEKLEARLL